VLTSLLAAPEDALILTASRRLGESLVRQLFQGAQKTECLLPTIMAIDEVAAKKSKHWAYEGLSKIGLMECLKTVKLGGIPEKIRLSKGFLDPTYQTLRELAHGGVTTARVPKRIRALFAAFQAWEKGSGLLAPSGLDPLGLHYKTVIILGFYSLTDEQLQVLKPFITQADDAHLLLHFESKKSRYKTCKPMLECIRTHFSDCVEQNHDLQPDQATSKIRHFSPESPDAEIHACAQMIQELSQIQTCALSDIGVVLPNFHAYKLLIEDIFRRYDIPFSISVGAPLAQSSPARFVDSLFQALEEGGDAKGSILGILRAARSIETFVSQLKNALRGTEMLEKIAPYRLDKTASSAYHSTFASTIKVLEVLDIVRANWEKSSGTGSLVDWVSHIRLMIDNTTFRSTLPTPDDSVWILSKREAFMIRKKAVFIMGVTEGNWPQLDSNTLLISQRDRQELGLPDRVSRYGEDQYLFHSLSAQAETVSIFSPTHQDQIPLLPSHFLQDISLGQSETHVPHPDLAAPFQKQLLQLGLYLRTCGDQKLDLQSFHRAFGAAASEAISYRLDAISNSTPDYGNLRTQSAALLARFERKPFSATQLESYQRCPYRFFHQSLLKLPEPSTSIDPISSQEWGQLLHTILYRAFQDSKLARSLRDRLFDAAEDVFSEALSPAFAWEVKRRILFGTAEFEGLLTQLAEVEAQFESPLVPLALESSFGGDDQPVSLAHDGTPMRLRGRIDAVLTDPAKEYFFVLDYKTGPKIPAPIEIERYESLQLPFYLLSAKQSYPDLKPGGGLIYQINAPNTVKKVLICVTKDAKSSLFEESRKRPFFLDDGFWTRFEHHLTSLKNAMGRGEFGFTGPKTASSLASKRPQYCSHCSYQRICRFPKRFSSKR